MDKNTLVDLFRHMEWADATVWRAVLASEPVREDKRVRDTLYHIHVVQRAFLRTWRGEPRHAPYPEFDDARSLMEWGRTVYGEAFAHLEELTSEQLGEALVVPWGEMVEKRLGRPPEPTTTADTALQVVLHSMYHRGQVNTRVREAGGEPPLVDYILWVWTGRPAPDWP